MAFSTDGRTVVSIGSEAALYVWNARGGALIRRIPLRTRPKCLALGDGDRYAACGYPDGRIGLLDVTGDSGIREFGVRPKAVTAIIFSPNGKLLACGHEDGEIQIWTTEPLKPKHKLTGHRGIVMDFAFSRAGTTLVSVGDDATLRSWDIITLQQLRTIPLARIKDDAKQHWFPAKVAISADERTLTLGTNSGEIITWAMDCGGELWRVDLNAAPVTSVCFSEDGAQLAVATSDSIGLFTAKAGQQLPMGRDWGTASAMLFLNKGTILAAAGYSKFHRWNLRTGQDELRRAGHSWAVDCVSFAPDGKTLATVCANDGTVRVWDVATGRQTLFLEQKEQPPGRLPISWST